MSQSPKLRGLGRGLSALLGDDDVAAAIASSPPPAAPAPEPARATPARTQLTLPIAQLHAGKYQPRTSFEGLDALVDSVRQFGLLQPILVRPVFGDPTSFEIIAGERRWRAAQKAQLHEVPVVIRNLDDLDALQLALVENLQRADLSPIDEASGYQEELARIFASFSPFSNYVFIATDLTETGINADDHWESLSSSYEKELGSFTSKKYESEKQKNPAFTSNDYLDLRDRPRFHYKPPGIVERADLVVLPFGLLLGFVVLFLGAAVVSFLKYDVR